MKFQIEDEITISKSKYGDLNTVLGKRGVIKHCWSISEPVKPFERQQPEFDVEINGKHFIVLEEEMVK